MFPGSAQPLPRDELTFAFVPATLFIPLEASGVLLKHYTQLTILHHINKTFVITKLPNSTCSKPTANRKSLHPTQQNGDLCATTNDYLFDANVLHSQMAECTRIRGIDQR
jgi:hypothetical protein